MTYLIPGPNSCTPTTLNIYPVTSTWTTGMTWSGTNVGVDKQPSVTTSSAYAASKSFAHGIEGTCANATETIDVTKMVRVWMNDEIPNYGMALRASETDQAAYKAFCSLNFNTAGSSCNVATRQPTLTITYNTPPAMVADTLTTGPGTVCKTGADRPVISSSTPTLHGSATDVDIADRADQTRIRAEVWAIQGSGAATSGYAPYVTEGTITSWTVPAGALVDGTYKWRAQSDDGFDTSPYWSDWCEFTVDSQLAPAHEQTDLALRTFYEHTIGAGPTASEAQLRTTPQGQAALASFLGRQDALRAEHVSAGIVTTSITPSLIFTGAVVVASDTVTFPVTTAWTTNRLIAGSNEASAGNDNWMVTLRTVDDLWALDNLVQPVIPQDESQLVIDPNEPVQEASIGPAFKAPGSNRALRATPSSASVTNTGVDIAAMVAYAFKWSGTAVQHGRTVDLGNPAFPNFGDYDCQNFISQSLRSGGWQESWIGNNDDTLGIWYSPLSGRYETSQTWRLNNDFFYVMKKRGGKLIYKGASIDKSKLRAGDVIQYDFDTDGRLNHGQMVTKVKNSVPYISQHSGWRQEDLYTDSFSNANGVPGTLTMYVWRP